ncbi:MAG: zinc-binding dehydrogenase [Actinobacteria bacterium]|nr:zinc-binding dehydrogenase [Actinomycetota bacterium]
MRAVTLHGPRSIEVGDVPDPSIVEPTDVIVKVALSCICGSDLWPYRGVHEVGSAQRIGHEFVGTVVEVGSAVGSLRPGDFVISPFSWSDGTCPACRDGVTTGCRNGGFWGQPGSDGGQGEFVRVPFADATLVALPEPPPRELWPALLTLSDVMATGHHAAVCAHVAPGGTVGVVGDGAVGLCGILAARRLGAGQVIALSRNPARQAVAQQFGASDVVPERGRDAVAAVRELTGGRGVDHVLECVGTQESLETAIHIARRGGSVGFVGVPHLTDPKPISDLFARSVGLRGGGAWVRTYLPELLADVMAGSLDPSAVFDLTLPLEEAAEGYRAMDERRAIKVLLELDSSA